MGSLLAIDFVIFLIRVCICICLYTAISIKVVPGQSGKVEYEREGLLEIAVKN
jgi:hypothetical protein